MNTVPLPDLTIWLDGQHVECETLLTCDDRRSMMLNTFVPVGEYELHSSYVDAGGQTVVASHLIVAADLPPEPSMETLAECALARACDRRHCLLEHLALLRDAIESGGYFGVRLEIGEAALEIADRPMGRPA